MDDRPTVLLLGGESWRATVATVLEKRLGAHTLSAPGVASGFDHFEREQIDCVITDYPLDDIDVPTFLKDVQANRPALPTVVYTSDGDEYVASEVSVTDSTYVNHDDHDRLDQLAQVVERGIERHQERVALERDLQRSEELHRVTLNNMTDTVLITDENGEFTYICPNIHFIFGYTVEEVCKMGSIDTLLGEDLFNSADLRAKGVLTNIECTATDRAGREHTLLVNVKRVSIQDGTTLYSCRDITARKHRENALTVLHNTARELLYAETDREIAHQVVEDAAEVLDVVSVAYYPFAGVSRAAMGRRSTSDHDRSAHASSVPSLVSLDQSVSTAEYSTMTGYLPHHWFSNYHRKPRQPAESLRATAHHTTFPMNTTESPSDSTAFDHSTSDTQILETLCDQLDQLTERVDELEATVERKNERIKDLEGTVERQNALLEALRRKAGGTREMLTELQSRELEKKTRISAGITSNPTSRHSRLIRIASRSSSRTTATPTPTFLAVMTH